MKGDFGIILTSVVASVGLIGTAIILAHAATAPRKWKCDHCKQKRESEGQANEMHR